MNTGKLWDIFCQVIDNFGDMGVCWRLSQDLAARGERVRLWVDDASALQWMAPNGYPGVEVHVWRPPLLTDNLAAGDVLVEAFGCTIDPEFIAWYAHHQRARGSKGIWINLEYLTAETYAERSHGLRSPVMQGPGAGLNKYFFYPGFTASTGGLIRELNLSARQAHFNRNHWLRQQGIAVSGERLISLFCYEPAALETLLNHLADDATPSKIIVTAGRSRAALTACIQKKKARNPLWNKRNVLTFFDLPQITQHEYDHLLWCCDLNFVRGEDSLVRAIWAGKPFVWHIYPQHDNAHADKLTAFLHLIQAPPSLRRFHDVWNGLSDAPLPSLNEQEWRTTASGLHDLQQAHNDLVSTLIQFAEKNN